MPAHGLQVVAQTRHMMCHGPSTARLAACRVEVVTGRGSVLTGQPANSWPVASFGRGLLPISMDTNNAARTGVRAHIPFNQLCVFLFRNSLLGFVTKIGAHVINQVFLLLILHYRSAPYSERGGISGNNDSSRPGISGNNDFLTLQLH